MVKQLNVLFIGIIAALIFTLLFTFPLFGYLDKPLGSKNEIWYDFLLDIFVFEHNLSKISSLDLTNFLNTRMLYPYQNTWVFGNTYLPQSILSLPIYLFSKNVLLAANSTILINFFLSFIAMYLLAYQLSKNIAGSMIAGLIYTFNPYVWSHFHQLDLSALQWIPMIFLMTEKIIQKITPLRLVGLFSLFLIQLSASFYYTFFLILFLPPYFAIRVYKEKINIRKFLTTSVVITSMVFLFLGYLYIKPFKEVRALYDVKRPLYAVTILSARPGDFIFTTEDNRLYGWMVSHPFLQTLRHPFAAQHHTEHSLFLGLTAYFLFGLALYQYIKHKNLTNRNITSVYLILLGLSFLLSLGPYILIGQIQVPSFYLLIYKLIPFADSLRAMSRFAVMGFFSISVIICLFWRGKRWVSALIIVLILFEYIHILPKPYPISSEIKDFYSFLNNQPDIDVIVELPIANNLMGYPDIYRDPLADTIYLLYGIYHNKKIVNGYQAVIPFDTTILGQTLTIHFPTPNKLLGLKNSGVDAIIIHKEEYNNKKIAEDIIQKLRGANLREIYTSNSINAFTFDTWEAK